MKELFDFNLGLFLPVYDIVYIRQGPAVRGPEIFSTADVRYLFQRRLIQVDPLMHDSGPDHGFDSEWRRPLPSHTDCIDLDIQSLNSF